MKKRKQEYKTPVAEGLYDPTMEKDACGVGFIANVNGQKSRKIIDLALESLSNLEHRGAVGADLNTGDGSGIMLQIPDVFFRNTIKETNKLELPPLGRYGVGFIYLPQDSNMRLKVQKLIEKITIKNNLDFLCWRDVPIIENVPGETAKKTLPYLRQCFIAASDDITTKLDFERKLYLVRRSIDQIVRKEYKLDRIEYYVASFSCRTIVYKGMLTAEQLIEFYPDLQSTEMSSALAIIHQRYSTNTFPTWDLAQPFRMIAHNGEINTIRGNQNWMMTRQKVMESSIYNKDINKILPIIMKGQSDSSTFDAVFELFCMTGRKMSHAMMMMVPEAWSKNLEMSDELRRFYAYHAAIQEPWDGPTAIAFTDGDVIGASLDRNGLRPGRYLITKDKIVIMASEVGTIPIKPSEIAYSERLYPGRMLLINTKEGRFIHNDDNKKEISQTQPYGLWVQQNMLRIDQLPEPELSGKAKTLAKDKKLASNIREKQRIFGYTNEILNLHLSPMATQAQEPIGSMGVDSSLAILSDEPFSLFSYFKQQFAQVTNPPIDPLREDIVMELTSYIGPEENLLGESSRHVRRIELDTPILSNKNLNKIKNISTQQFKTNTIDIVFNYAKKEKLKERLEIIKNEAIVAVSNGCSLLILSDKKASADLLPIPSLLAISTVHHTLIQAGLRTLSGLVIESGEAHLVSHFAMLIAYGANAINPYLAFESLEDMHKRKVLPSMKINDSQVNNTKEAEFQKEIQKSYDNYITAIDKGLLKIFSKMGISTLQSYCGAQIFEAIGLSSKLIDDYFHGTQSKIEGLSIESLEEECIRRHKLAYTSMAPKQQLPSGGVHHYRKFGIKHLLDPKSIYLLQHSTHSNDYGLYQEYAQHINEQNDEAINLRGLLKLKSKSSPKKTSIPLAEVEAETEILKRFSTGAMSFGAISWEAHTDLAIAMNQINGKSNTGEGGEDPIRFQSKNGKSMRSAIKQVASGRFGVTSHYLVNADDIQIKIAQGAKPGEGGQLPGHKVDAYIAKLRFSTPQVTLISPPPHHDIYSIEDIKQLIFDLKNVNPRARISVKLVSESGVGTVAAGVTKATADHIHISGFSGGTGASPISSIHYAGMPWELGLSETHQTLLIQGLRDRVYLGVDGKILTGRDVVIAAILGADEFSFSIAPLIVLGCIMMRKCHLNTCPVGIASQDPILRKRYHGKADDVVNYMYFVAREIREIMAELGIAKFNNLIGQTDLIETKIPKEHWKARDLDLSRLLHKPKPNYGTKLYRSQDQNHHLEKQLDKKIIQEAKQVLDPKNKNKKQFNMKLKINNRNRSLGAMLSGEIARLYGAEALPAKIIHLELEGFAGQSFGAFINKGISFCLWGQANDYVGKGMCGGHLVIRVPKECDYKSWENIIIGNTCFYGATSGEAYCEGVAGERFCVRNSGLNAVIEGIGDHGCEYMTGGRVAIIGKTGRNFASGMSGGIAYVYDLTGNFTKNLNPAMVDLEDLSQENDKKECLDLIENHFKNTASKRAQFILKNWQEEQAKFIKIIPKDYKRFLSTQPK